VYANTEHRVEHVFNKYARENIGMRNERRVLVAGSGRTTSLASASAPVTVWIFSIPWKSYGSEFNTIAVRQIHAAKLPNTSMPLLFLDSVAAAVSGVA
jgi:hypothetical protein